MDAIYINLIHEKEQRSGALVTPKFLVICACSIGIGFLAAFSAVKLYRIHQLKARHQNTVNTLRELKQREAKEKKLDTQFHHAAAYAREMIFWRDSQPDWSRLLYKLASVVPENIQIERLNCTSEVVPAGETPKLQQKLDLYCRVFGDRSEIVVRDFHREITDRLDAQDSPIRNFRPIPSMDPSRLEFSFQVTCMFDSGVHGDSP